MRTATVTLLSLLFSCVWSHGVTHGIGRVGNQPVFVLTGDVLEVIFPEKKLLKFRNSIATVSAEITWAERDDEFVGTIHTIGLQAGHYLLHVEGESPIATVFVLDSYEENYRIEIHRNVTDGDALKRRIRLSEKQELDWLIVLGAGSVSEYEAILLESPIPIVFAGASDRDMVVVYGKDAWFVVGRASDPHELVKRRSRLMSSRWSVGIMGEKSWTFLSRSQLVLLVDSPLDYFVGGQSASTKDRFGDVPGIDWRVAEDAVQLNITELSIKAKKSDRIPGRNPVTKE